MGREEEWTQIGVTQESMKMDTSWKRDEVNAGSHHLQDDVNKGDQQKTRQEEVINALEKNP